MAATEKWRPREQDAFTHAYKAGRPAVPGHASCVWRVLRPDWAWPQPYDHILAFRYRPGLGDLKCYFLDVGVGDCTLIELPNGEFMLVDIYRRQGQGTVDVFKVLRDFLTDGDADKKLLHYLVVTHAHDDHIWGIGDLADEFEIG